VVFLNVTPRQKLQFYLNISFKFQTFLGYVQRMREQLLNSFTEIIKIIFFVTMKYKNFTQ